MKTPFPIASLLFLVMCTLQINAQHFGRDHSDPYQRHSSQTTVLPHSWFALQPSRTTRGPNWNILFLMDATGSVTRSTFRPQRTFVNRMVNTGTSPQSKVGIVKFSTNINGRGIFRNRNRRQENDPERKSHYAISQQDALDVSVKWNILGQNTDTKQRLLSRVVY